METYDTPVDSLVLRRARSTDIAYITNSWLKGYRKSAAVWNVKSSEFYAYEHKLLEDILPRATTLVLSNKERPDQIVGYICYEVLTGNHLVLHYVNIKAVFQKRGFGRLIVEEVLDIEKPASVTWTYRTEDGVNAMRANKDQTAAWRHSPYLKYALAAPGWFKEKR